MHWTLNHRGAQGFFEHARFYDAVFGRRLFQRLHQRAVADLTAELPDAAHVLDAGCGPGRLALLLARRRPDVTVHGVDLAHGMIEYAKSVAERAGLSERVRFTEADLAELPFDSDSFDVVVSTYSFHHWQSVGPVVQELGRVLRPDGRVRVYDARMANAEEFLEAARTAFPEGNVGATPIRTSWFPIPLNQVMWAGFAGTSQG